MSNLIKNVYFTVDEKDKRIIDSDAVGKDAYPEIYKFQNLEDDVRPFGFKQLGIEEETDEFQDAGAEFDEGINVISVDEVREEEKRKISEELEQEHNNILEEARIQAQEIIDNATISAEEIKNEAFEEGRNQGFEEGKKQGLAEIEERRIELEMEYNAKSAELSRMAESLEPGYAEIVAGLVEKLTGVICRDKKDIIVYLIDKALHGIEKTKNITLHISKEDMVIVSSKKDELVKELSSETEFNIIEDASLVHNQCIIDLDSKIIDCSLDTQLDSLKEQLKMLAM